MSVAAGGELHQEIIIVRRAAHDEDEAHHGGVWKIAFADFMTAMMCFFLVMWLINAANEQTKAAVASYFNPIKLIDRNTARKGIDDPAKTPGDPDTATQKENHETDSRKHSDKNLFADPYAVLAEIAGETGKLQNISARGDGGAQDSGPATGASGGQTYRDPFAPKFWSQQVDMPKDAAETARSGSAENSAMTQAKTEDDGKPVADEMIAAAKAETEAGKEAAKPGAGSVKPIELAMTPPNKVNAPGATAASGTSETHMENAAARPDAGEATKPGEQTVKAARQIRQELASSFGGDDKIYKGLTVTETDKGVLISVSDQFNFGMFEIGSAVPTRDTVLAMEKISRILSTHKGNIRVDGHTDGRPFKNGAYDNWRLSSARAQSAYYMLLRAGLDEKRVMEVAGFADRRLKVKDDPYAAANRRIDILLETK